MFYVSKMAHYYNRFVRDCRAKYGIEKTEKILFLLQYKCQELKVPPLLSQKIEYVGNEIYVPVISTFMDYLPKGDYLSRRRMGATDIED